MGMSQGWVWLSGRSWGKFLLLATEWGIIEQSLYGIEGWSSFRGCFTTRVYVAVIRTLVVAVIWQLVVLQGWSLSEVPL